MEEETDQTELSPGCPGKQGSSEGDEREHQSAGGAQDKMKGRRRFKDKGRSGTGQRKGRKKESNAIFNIHEEIMERKQGTQ